MKRPIDEIAASDFIIGDDSVTELFRTKDWSSTLLGPLHSWPQSLRTSVSMVLKNPFPSLILWGPSFIQLYNEEYSRLIKDRHPSALGTPYKECWPEVWDVTGPKYEQVFKSGEAVEGIDFPLPFPNEADIILERYFTFAYSPIYVEHNKLGGVLNTLNETTEKVISERQLKGLRDLYSHTTGSTSTNGACLVLGQTLQTMAVDISFAAIYLIRPTERKLELVQVANISRGTDLTPDIVYMDVPTMLTDKQQVFAKVLLQVATTDESQYFELKNYEVPASTVWIEAPYPRGCVVLPIESANHKSTLGVLVAGLSPRRNLDENYKGFLNLVAMQMAAVLGNAKAHEEERQKAEMLAELDRAKTIFFSNISHEFRTPITLMLGPIEDLILKESGNKIVSQLELIHRNALRLLKLVNTLLDFSRIESGRMDAYFEATDISKLTKDLASIFRAACEKAGLEFIVECPEIEDKVYLDADMYEKIVLNLISNAYKFTLKGHIAIKLAQLGPYAVQLSVEDTGSGIPEEHLPRLFERFHRVPESKGRSHEGTGIGLAMVAELVKIHGGTIQAFSKINQGTIFVVNFQIGSSHLPPERLIARGGKSSQSYTRSAEWWIGGLPTDEVADVMQIETSSDGTRSHILFCDDNADMREYIRSLLGDQYDLDIAVDGIDALEMIEKRKPELILTDIMMPRLDGLGLLQRVRENPDTKTIPIIFLSARAGEEARVEGLKLGADDYLTKPFTARELQARIKTHLELCKARQEATLKAELANKAKDQFLAVLSHELRTPLTPALLLAESLQHYKNLPAATIKDLELITKNIKLEVRLIDDLLDVTKITKNKLVLTMAPVDAHDELKHTINLVKHDAEDKLITFDVDLAAKEYFISADSSRLQQIFWNLVKNAVKFTPKGGKIGITTRNEGSDMICVKVKDSGIGMEEALLPKIFESFQQGTSITHQFGGLGLGLSISKALTELMHGKIWASSEGLGLGAEFTVIFPILKGVQSSPTPLSSAPLQNEHVPSQKILLVEDNKSTALVMTRFLKKLGHVVSTAYCVREALDMAQKNKFELVVSDLGLPDGSGFDLMKSLHSLYGLRGICVSGYGMEEDLRKSRECGFDIHIVKPVEISSLRSAIAIVVQKIRDTPLN